MIHRFTARVKFFFSSTIPNGGNGMQRHGIPIRCSGRLLKHPLGSAGEKDGKTPDAESESIAKTGGGRDPCFRTGSFGGDQFLPKIIVEEDLAEKFGVTFASGVG